MWRDNKFNFAIQHVWQMGVIITLTKELKYLKF
jgi:hypothetical protein